MAKPIALDAGHGDQQFTFESGSSAHDCNIIAFRVNRKVTGI
jgi:hypothetical protein